MTTYSSVSRTAPHAVKSSSLMLIPVRSQSQSEGNAMGHGNLHTKLISKRLELVKVRLILLLVLHFLLDTVEDADSSRVVVHATGGADGGLYNSRCGDEIMGEAVVETTLDLEEILRSLEEVDVALRKGLEGLRGVCAGRGTGEGRGDAGRCGAGTEERGGELSTQHVGGVEDGE